MECSSNICARDPEADEISPLHIRRHLAEECRITFPVVVVLQDSWFHSELLPLQGSAFVLQQCQPKHIHQKESGN